MNDFALWVNGVKVNFDITGNVPSASVLSELSFDRGDTFNSFEGKVKATAVFKEVLTDTELQNLTS